MVHGIDEDFVSIHNLLYFVPYGYDGDKPAGNLTTYLGRFCEDAYLNLFMSLRVHILLFKIVRKCRKLWLFQHDNGPLKICKLIVV